MSVLFKSISFTLAVMGYLMIPLMIFFAKVTGNYWTDIWDKNASVEPRAQGILLLFILSFMTLVIGEVVEFVEDKRAKKTEK